MQTIQEAGQHKGADGRKTGRTNGHLAIQITTVVAMVMFSGVALATGDDPMGTGMCKFVTMVTGKWVYGVGVVGLVGVALTFIFGVEMNEFMKKVASAVAALSFMMAAPKMVAVFASLFGVTAVC